MLRRGLGMYGLLLAVLWTLAACQPVQRESAVMPEVVIHAHDYKFEVPAQVEAGLVKLALVNDGQEPHHAQLVRLNDGVTFEQFETALHENVGTALPLVTQPGGAAPIDSGATTSVFVNLTPGNYAVLCFIPSPDGTEHFAKGMITPLTVVAGTGEQSEPLALGTVTLEDFTFVLPSDIQAGKQTWKVVNKGKQPHEINLLKLAAGKTLDDLHAWMAAPSGPPPVHNVGGFNGIEPNQAGWMELDLTPGQYVAICHIPDPATGKAHADMGMLLPFEVQ